jgi:uncharacterized protein (TIGR03382 family)
MENLSLQALTLAAVVALPAIAAGQQLISSFHSAYTEGFNSFAGKTWTVPANFAVTNAGAGNLSEPYFNGFYDSAGPYLSNSHIYALHDGADPSDIAFGMKMLSGQRNPVFLEWSFVNGTGTTISSFAVQWDFQQFSNANRATRITADYNPAGSGWTVGGIVGVNEQTAPQTSVSANHPVRLSTTNSFDVHLAAPLQPGESILFRWGFHDGSGWGPNGHVAVNNLSVQAIPEPATFALALGVALAVVALRRRR